MCVPKKETEGERLCDLQLLGNVAAMRDDGIGGNEQMLGNLLVCHALDEGNDNLPLAVAESLVRRFRLANDVLYLHAHVALP